MRIIDKIYRFEWANKESGDSYALNVYASDNTTLTGVVTEYLLNPEAIKDIELKWEREIMGLPSACTLKLKIDINKIDVLHRQNLADILFEPFKDYTFTWLQSGGDLSGFSISESFIGGNVFYLQVFKSSGGGDDMFFIQKGGGEGVYKDGVFEIECYHVSRVAAETVKLTWFKDLWNISSTTLIKDRQCTWEIFYIDGMPRVRAIVATQTPRFWFVPFKLFEDAINLAIREVTKKLIRYRYTPDISDSYVTTTYYEQSYDLANTLGTAIDYANVLFLGFIADKNYANKATANILKRFTDELDNYKTIWDYLKALCTQMFNRVSFDSDSFRVQRLFDGAPYDISDELISQLEAEFFVNIIQRAETSLNEFNSNDIKNHTVIRASSASENTLTIPIVINNIPTDANYIMAQLITKANKLRANFTLAGSDAAVEGVLMNNLYYYYDGTYVTDYTFIRVHSLFTLDFGNGVTSADMGFTAHTYDPAPLSTRFQSHLQQLNSCKTSILPRIAINLFNQNTQNRPTISVKCRIRNNYDNLKALFIGDRPFEVDLSSLNSSGLDITSGISNKFYISEITCKLLGGSRENNYIEVKGVNNQWEYYNA